MRTLAIDIETYSGIDLAKCGVYAYVEHEAFKILLFGYAFDEEEVQVIDLEGGEELPAEVKAALVDEAVLKTAFNANFERTCLGAYLKVYLLSEQWSCTAVKALCLGLPVNLEEASKFLKLPQQKMAEGKALIKYFSRPHKALGACEDHKWELFKSYCKRDVEVERSLRRLLDKYQLTEKEKRLWCLDQRINDRGVRADRKLVKQAISCDIKHQEGVKAEAAALTGLLNPKSAAQLKKWLQEAEGLETLSLSKENVKKLLPEVRSPEARRVLKLRQELSKTSIKKYEAIDRALCIDGRIRGLFQFYGASRTGRWAGRLVQVQNLPQNKLPDLSLARRLLKEGQFEYLELLFESTPQVLSQLIRTAFIPSENCSFIVADFSAIEARVIAWLAGESWRQEVFKDSGKIYEASASKMFKIPVEEITRESPLRQKGKIAELALCYGGSISALKAMGAEKLGLKEQELCELVTAWRASNSCIVGLWSQVEKAALKAVWEKTTVKLHLGVSFEALSGLLFIKLPSGRRLSYPRPVVEKDQRYNLPKLTYEGIEQTTRQWGRLSTYGGKLVENIVQAIARDCLAEAMLNLEEAGYRIVMHCHDEVVLEVPKGFGSVNEVQEIMGRELQWARGLKLTAEAFGTEWYRK